MYGYFRDCAKERELIVDGGTVEDVLRRLIDSFDRFGGLLLDEAGSGDSIRIKPYVKVMVNGRGIEVLDGVKTRVGAEDALVIFPPVGGG